MRDPTTRIPEEVESDAVVVIAMMLSIDPSACDLVLERQGIIEINLPNEDPCREYTIVSIGRDGRRKLDEVKTALTASVSQSRKLTGTFKFGARLVMYGLSLLLGRSICSH